MYLASERNNRISCKVTGMSYKLVACTNPKIFFYLIHVNTRNIPRMD